MSENQSTPERSDDELPQWARDRLSDARNDAARYRVKAREAADTARAEVEAQFADQLKAAADKQAATDSELATTRTELTKLTVALGAGIPTESAVEFASLLQGSTVDEIKAHAKRVRKLFNVSPAASVDADAHDPSQGHGTPPDRGGDFFVNYAFRD